MKKKINRSYEFTRVKRIDHLQDILSKLINEAQTQGPRSVTVKAADTDVIQMIHERLKQAEIPIKTHKQADNILYIINSPIEIDIETGVEDMLWYSEEDFNRWDGDIVKLLFKDSQED